MYWKLNKSVSTSWYININTYSYYSYYIQSIPTMYTLRIYIYTCVCVYIYIIYIHNYIYIWFIGFISHPSIARWTCHPAILPKAPHPRQNSTAAAQKAAESPLTCQAACWLVEPCPNRLLIQHIIDDYNSWYSCWIITVIIYSWLTIMI
jgi:hypothetical protein